MFLFCGLIKIPAPLLVVQVVKNLKKALSYASDQDGNLLSITSSKQTFINFLTKLSFFPLIKVLVLAVHSGNNNYEKKIIILKKKEKKKDFRQKIKVFLFLLFLYLKEKKNNEMAGFKILIEISMARKTTRCLSSNQEVS